MSMMPPQSVKEVATAVQQARMAETRNAIAVHLAVVV